MRLISRGERVYQDALRNPDSLASVVKPDDEVEYEELSYLHHEVWEASHDDEFPDNGLRRIDSPTGD
ncbi:MAG: DUF4240 domain-containing protein, partial [Planctomycetes bacterium]|nr:DUF4240 domain-containing protein [Planctomycetota bacterium]